MDLAYLSCAETPSCIDGASSQKSAGTSTNAFAVPASATDGRIVLMHVIGNSETDTIAPPAGWTTIVDDGAANNRVCLFGKVCSGESGTWTFTKTGGGGGWRCSSAVLANAAMPTIYDLQRVVPPTVLTHNMPVSVPNSMCMYFFGQENASPTNNGSPQSSPATGVIVLPGVATNTGASPCSFVFASAPGGGGGGTENAAPWLKGIAWTETGMASSSAAQVAAICLLVPPAL